MVGGVARRWKPKTVEASSELLDGGCRRDLERGRLARKLDRRELGAAAERRRELGERTVPDEVRP
ncbi:MAG: hypothetical protein ACRDNG_09980, partial [Gaiellaceae bacterium]